MTKEETRYFNMINKNTCNDVDCDTCDCEELPNKPYGYFDKD